jgi:L-lactate dehydrogenase complex protein LldG
MSERENILGRISEALKLSAPVPGAHGKAHPAGAHAGERHTAREWLPPVGDTQQALIDLFRANSTDLKTDFRLLERPSQLIPELKALAASEGWKKIGFHRGELTDAAVPCLGMATINTSEPYAATDLESCDVGISECDALVAQTGTIVVTSQSAGGRALSVLPPHHVVIARREQLLPDLPAAFAYIKQKYAPEYPSLISLITGPSRTGDIERILVLGAHGPKRLTVFCF